MVSLFDGNVVDNCDVSHSHFLQNTIAFNQKWLAHSKKCNHKTTAAIRVKSVSQRDKLLAKILIGTSDANITFTELCQLLIYLGFEERIRGSHHIFSKDGVEEILNLQPKRGKAKAYQVKQVREVILKYRLGNQDEHTL